MADSIIKDSELGEEENHPHGRHGPHGGLGPKHGGHEGVPPHILKEIFDLKEKVGKLEGMLEVLIKKM